MATLDELTDRVNKLAIEMVAHDELTAASHQIFLASLQGLEDDLAAAGEVVTRDEFDELAGRVLDLENTMLFDPPDDLPPDIPAPMPGMPGPASPDPDNPELDTWGRRTALADDGTRAGLMRAVDRALKVAVAAHERILLVVPRPITGAAWTFGDGALVIPDIVSVKGIGSPGPPVQIHKTDNTRGFDGMIQIFATQGLPVEVTNLELISHEADDLDDVGVMVNGGVSLYAHHNILKNWGRAAIEMTGQSLRNGATPGQNSGIIFKNHFEDGINSGKNLGYGVAINGDPEDLRPVVPGGLDMVYIESNEFHGKRHATASNFASRYVARHNHVYRQLKNAHSFDAHGAAAWKHNGVRWGSRWTEVYKNTVHTNNAGVRNSDAGVAIRGGGCVVYANNLDNEIAWSSGVPRAIAFRLEKTGSPHPIPWQIGDPAIMPGPDWTRLGYAWDNRYHDDPVAVYLRVGEADWLVKGRDWFDASPLNYTPAPYPHPWIATIPGA